MKLCNHFKHGFWLVIVVLVALRIGIGCHFLYEGVWKFANADKFSSTSYTGMAKGPAKPLFDLLAGDVEGSNRFLVRDVVDFDAFRSVTKDTQDFTTKTIADTVAKESEALLKKKGKMEELAAEYKELVKELDTTFDAKRKAEIKKKLADLDTKAEEFNPPSVDALAEIVRGVTESAFLAAQGEYDYLACLHEPEIGALGTRCPMGFGQKDIAQKSPTLDWIKEILNLNTQIKEVEWKIRCAENEENAANKKKHIVANLEKRAELVELMKKQQEALASYLLRQKVEEKLLNDLKSRQELLDKLVQKQKAYKAASTVPQGGIRTYDRFLVLYTLVSDDKMSQKEFNALINKIADGHEDKMRACEKAAQILANPDEFATALNHARGINVPKNMTEKTCRKNLVKVFTDIRDDYTLACNYSGEIITRWASLKERGLLSENELALLNKANGLTKKQELLAALQNKKAEKLSVAERSLLAKGRINVRVKEAKGIPSAQYFTKLCDAYLEKHLEEKLRVEKEKEAARKQALAELKKNGLPGTEGTDPSNIAPSPVPTAKTVTGTAAGSVATALETTADKAAAKVADAAAEAKKKQEERFVEAAVKKADVGYFLKGFPLEGAPEREKERKALIAKAATIKSAIVNVAGSPPAVGILKKTIKKLEDLTAKQYRTLPNELLSDHAVVAKHNARLAEYFGKTLAAKRIARSDYWRDSWQQLQRNCVTKYKMTPQQQVELDLVVNRYIGEVNDYLAMNEEDIIRHFDNYVTWKSAAANDAPYAIKRHWDTERALRKNVVNWASAIEGLEKNLCADITNRILTNKQLQSEGYALPMPYGFIDLIDLAVMSGLVVMGLCLILGLATRLAALGAAGFMCFVWLSQLPFPWIYPAAPPVLGHALGANKDFIELLACLVLVVTGAGRWAGLDYYLEPLVAGPLKKCMQKFGCCCCKADDDAEGDDGEKKIEATT